MGLLKQLTGIENHEGALNAVLALRLLRNSTHPLAAICDQIAEIMWRVSPSHRQSRDEIISELSQDSLVTQMNFVALACVELGYSAQVSGMGWYVVQNPYRLRWKISDEHLKAAVSTVKRYGADAFWPDAAERRNWTLASLLRGPNGTNYTPDSTADLTRVIVSCPSCGQSARVPSGKRLRIKCPRCEESWVEGTSDLDGSTGPGATAAKKTGWDIIRPGRS